MIRLNIISRIAGDKDFFSHYLETVSEIFSENNITIFVNFRKKILKIVCKIF